MLKKAGFSMSDKFYNYLYDYLLTKNILTSNPIPQDQKQKRLLVTNYLGHLETIHRKVFSSSRQLIKILF